MNIFEFVINPDDYAQSVENIFYLSFLIRDGRVAFETDEDAIPIICMYVHWISVLPKPSICENTQIPVKSRKKMTTQMVSKSDRRSLSSTWQSGRYIKTCLTKRLK